MDQPKMESENGGFYGYFLDVIFSNLIAISLYVAFGVSITMSSLLVLSMPPWLDFISLLIVFASLPGIVYVIYRFKKFHGNQRTVTEQE
ncbi:MAG TPA: hypothetical protein VKK79_05415 [Candidatus Lokiarchaeia archaeon]|nr:hypothetical protein [Candidatus Lokiarchaeia archaeon]